MKRLLIGLLVFAGLLGLIGSVTAIPRPPKVTAPSPDSLEAMLRSAEIGEPWQEGALTIFPVRLNRTPVFGEVLTLDQALDTGLLSIKEIGGGQVNSVTARNSSDRYVFLMAGQAIRGAKQDRMASEDILLPPDSTTEVAVWCVDHGRWTSGQTDFRAGEFVAPAAVRREAAVSKSQQRVWDSVAAVQRGVGAPSGSLATAADSGEVRTETQPYRDKLLPLAGKHTDTCGVIVARGNEFLAADIFYAPSLFTRLWPKLLDSYLLDIAGRQDTHGRPSAAAAERFLGQLYWARRTSASTPGAGKRIELRADAVYGSALIMKNSVVHLEAFPGAQILQQERPDQAPSLQYRRERLETQH
jgi:hypothetical protein